MLVNGLIANNIKVLEKTRDFVELLIPINLEQTGGKVTWMYFKTSRRNYEEINSNLTLFTKVTVSYQVQKVDFMDYCYINSINVIKNYNGIL